MIGAKIIIMKNYDIIIAGCGAAGLYSAINLSKDLKILITSKKELTLCNTALAQGGIAGVYKSPEDSPKLHKQDTFVAGGFENNPETTTILCEEAEIDIDRIINIGVEFDKNKSGDYHRTLEGGHGKHRIFHHKDTTGYEIEIKLLEYVKKLPNVDILENAVICDVKKTETGFSFDILEGEEHTVYNSHYAVIATGGIGRVYERTTNSAIATGDGIAFAYNMGAKIHNISYIQFHPTAFNDQYNRECFLISEAVRGEGAYLKNCYGERFMQNYDKRLELAPRDVVSHSIMFEASRTGSNNFYIDISHKDSEFIKNRFPMIYDKLIQLGFDMTTDMIPIFPCQHYLMGGIKVDKNAETTVSNLFACGECSCTGVHGNNRLASNSLLEALVFSRRAANVINERCLNSETSDFVSADFKHNENAPHIPKGIRTEIRKIMQTAYFVMPDIEALFEGYDRINQIKEILCTGNFKVDRDYVEAKSIATVAYLILQEANRTATENAEIDAAKWAEYELNNY